MKSIRTPKPNKKTSALLELKELGYTFKSIAEMYGLTENQVKNRIYRHDRKAVPVIKGKPANLSASQKDRAAHLHYFGYPPCEIASDINANSDDVRAYVNQLPRHPEFRKKSA